MINISKHKVGISIIGLFLFILIITAVLSSGSHKSSKEIENRFASSIQILQQDVAQLESRIEAFGELARENQASIRSLSTVPTVSDPRDLQSLIDGKKTKKSAKAKDQQGIFAAMENMDREVLKEMYDKAVREKNINSQQEILREINLEQREMDKDLYDETVAQLLKRTIPRRRGSDLGNEDREEALKALLDQYPDSYAAAKAVSNEVIDSLRNGNIERAEGNYNLLLDLQRNKGDSVVLDSGVEAVPQMSNALAYAYMRRGMTDPIVPIIEKLETNYSDSLVRLIFRRGAAKMVTGEEAATRIRKLAGAE